MKLGREFQLKMKKKAGILNQVLIQIILIGIIFALFLFATADKINGKGVKQQVLEKEIALLIDVAEPGMDFEVSKLNVNGLVTSIRLSEEKVFVGLDGVASFMGYPYFTPYDVKIFEEADKFIVRVR